MQIWNRPISDRRWNDFWATVFCTAYLVAVVFTMLDPRWHKVSIALVFFALGWYSTTAHYARKSMTGLFYRGKWYKNFDEVKSDPNL